MCYEYFFVNAMTKWKLLEELIEKLINFLIILMLYFSIESIQFIELLSLMISSTHEKVIRVAYFPG